MASRHETRVRQFSELRRRAEEILRNRIITLASNTAASSSSEEALRALHELSVHQIELEMQNEELNRALEAVDAARARYSEFYDLSPAGFCSLSDQGTILEANLTLGRMLGLPCSELVGQTIARFILDEDKDVHGLPFRRLFATGDPYTCDLGMVDRDGIRFWVHLAAVSARSGSGATVCRAVMSDITELRLAHANILRMAEDLERRVKERTAELEFTNLELETFSVSVAQDLRSPIHTIQGFSEALLETYREKLDETGRNYLSRIRHGAERMGDLIEDLLKLSHVVRSEVCRAEIDLSAVCREVLAGLSLAHPQRRVEVSLTEGMLVQADSRLIKVAVENLLNNAWKYTSRAKETRITVGEQRSACGSRIFFIRDNGAGFDMAHAGKLFTPFQRLHASQEYEGLGIGLAIVQRIIRRHGGKIWAEAEPGSGATFFFTIPERVES